MVSGVDLTVLQSAQHALVPAAERRRATRVAAEQHEKHNLSWWVLLLHAGRRDDLWSWLYIMVEMLTGTLPWRSEEGRDREQVRAVHDGADGRPRERTCRRTTSPCDCAVYGKRAS